MEFVGMKSIKKTLGPNPREGSNTCTDWVATEKVHGSSFQFITCDGINIHAASRRQKLDSDGSFLKCNIKTLLSKYGPCIKRLWEVIANEEKWSVYRTLPNKYDNDDVDDEEDINDEEEEEADLQEEDESISEAVGGGGESGGEGQENQFILRIYGELYGGGGVTTDYKPAVQKEILYSDDFRFYVFAITVNKKWMNNSELNELCQQVGFPYYAKPVCEPKATIEEVKEWLQETNFLNSRSRLTDRTDDHKTFIEGVVLTPLTRANFHFHAIKILAYRFSDVRESQKHSKGSGKQPSRPNYCTKARYHSVISKLDIPEREQTDMVADMFIADIIEESKDDQVTDKQKHIWRAVVTRWLTEDGYHGDHNTGNAEGNNIAEGDADQKEDDDDEEGGMFDIFS